MNNLKIYENEEFGAVRTSVVNGEPVFCLSDVCKALGITNAGNVKSRLSERGIHNVETLTNGGIQGNRL